MTQPPFIFQIPSGLAVAERQRLNDLAEAFWGTPEGDCYVFTPGKGKKFVALWEGRFQYRGQWTPQNEKKARRTFTHPSLRKTMGMAEAVRLARQLKAFAPRKGAT